MRPLILFACVVALIGCGPQKKSRVELVDESGQGSRNVTLDFGVIGLSGLVERTLDLRNASDTPIDSLELVHLDGAPVQFGADLGLGEPFRVFVNQGPLAPGSRVVLRATAAMPKDLPPDGLLEATIAVRAPNSSDVTLHLRATVVADACAVPSLDFGLVRVGQSVVGRVTLDNPTDQPSSVIVGQPRGDPSAPEVYRVNGVLLGERTSLAPHSSLELVVEYAPNAAGKVDGIIGFEREGCGAQEIKLEGEAVDQFVTWSDKSLDCGYVGPGLSVTRPVELANEDHSPRTVKLSSSNQDAFALSDPDGALIHEVTVPGATPGPNGERIAGRAELRLLCRAGTNEGRMPGTLKFESVPAGEQGTISASMIVGGAEVEVEPAEVDFDTVAWFPNAEGWQQDVEIANAGSAPLGADFEANLFLGTRDAAGNYGPPWFAITPLNGDTSADEFTVELDASYDPAQGLNVFDGPGFVPLHIRFNPKSPGAKSARIDLFTSDLDEPVVPITLTSNVLQVPSCQYSITPASLDFGVIPPGETRDLSFTVRNDGTGIGDSCLIYPPTPKPSSFWLVDPPTRTVELAPGEERKFVVHAPGRPNLSSVISDTGQVSLRISSQAQPEAAVAITGTRAPDCLRILPWGGDFGTAKLSCGPAVRSLELLDRCPLPLAITGFSIPKPAGLPAGATSCADPMGCPEFSLQQVPTIPAGGLAMDHDSVYTQLSYAPIDVGSDEGLFQIDATIGGAPVTYYVPLHGNADPGTAATDVFQAPELHPQNIVIAVSDSTANHALPGYSGNVDAFIRDVIASSSDFRIGVVKCATSSAQFQDYTGSPDALSRRSGENYVESRFSDAMDISFTRSTPSDCAESLKDALASDNLSNDGLLDWNAELDLVVIQHDAPAPTAAQITELTEVMGPNRAGSVHLSAVAQGTCAAAPSWQNAAATTGGLFVDDCTPINWGSALAAITKRPQPSVFELRSAADPDQPIEVKVNGVPVAPVDANGDPAWHYDSATNTITFEPNAAPAPGDAVEVSYSRGC